MAQDTKQIAKNVADSLSKGISTTAAGIAAPTTTQESGIQSDAGKQLLQRAYLNSSNDPNLRGRLDQLRMGEASALASKEVRGLKFAQSLGAIRDRIADARFQAQQQNASSGFVGSGAEARSQRELGMQVNRTLTDQENQYLADLRQANAQLGVSRKGQIEALRGTGALNKAFAQQAVIESQRPGVNMMNMESDDNIFTKFAGAFGKDQTWSARLNEDAFKQSSTIQNLAQEFGIDVNSGDFTSKVGKAIQEVVTMKAGSTWDMTRDISVDFGNGPQVVGEQTKQLGEAIMDIAGGVLNIATVAIPAGSFLNAAGKTLIAGLGRVLETAAVDTIGAAITTESAATAISEALAAGGMDLTATGVVGDSIGATIAQSIGESGIQIGGEALAPEAISSMAEGLSSSIQQELVTSLGEEVAASLPVGQVRMGIQVADDTVQQLVLARTGQIGVTSELGNTLAEMGITSLSEITDEQIVQAATINAMGVLESEEIAAMVAEGSEAFVGSQGAVTAEAGVQGATQSAVSGVTQPAVQGATGLKRATQFIKGAFKNAKGAVGSAVSPTARGIGGAITRPLIQGTKAAVKTAVTSDIAAIADVLALDANIVSTVMDKLDKQGIPKDMAIKVLEEFAKTGKPIGGE